MVEKKESVRAKERGAGSGEQKSNEGIPKGVEKETTRPSAETQAFTLPCGWMDDRGGIHKDVEIAPLSGRGRMAIARADVRSNSGRIETEVVLDTVGRIGPVEKIGKKIALDLLSSDRDFILLKARLLTKGPHMALVQVCPHCGEKLNIHIDLDEDVPVRELNEGDYEIDRKTGKRAYRIKSEELEVDALLRFSDGADQEFISPLVRSNPIGASYKAFMRQLLEWRGERRFQSNLIEMLDVDQIEFIEAEAVRLAPGPDLSLWTTCDICQREFVTDVDIGDFFFRKPSRGSRA